MLQVRDGDVQEILQLLGYTQIFHDRLGLSAKVAINAEGRFSVNMGHLKVGFWERGLASWRMTVISGRTEKVDNTLISSLE